MSDLKPCPFCGSAELLGFEPSYEGGWTLVKCRKCGCSGPSKLSTSELEAAAHWNNRAATAEDVRAVGDEPVRLTAVATLRDDGDGGLEADWLLEGGTSELFEGMILLVADNDPTLCEDDGSAELYRHSQRPVVLPERMTVPDADCPERTNAQGWNACIADTERLNP